MCDVYNVRVVIAFCVTMSVTQYCFQSFPCLVYTQTLCYVAIFLENTVYSTCIITLFPASETETMEIWLEVHSVPFLVGEFHGPSEPLYCTIAHKSHPVPLERVLAE